MLVFQPAPHDIDLHAVHGGGGRAKTSRWSPNTSKINGTPIMARRFLRVHRPSAISDRL